MLKIATIGLGNAGSQVTELATKLFNIDGVAVNTSKDDVSNVRLNPAICIGDRKGAGKDRNIAKKFLRDGILELLEMEAFIAVINENDVIVLTASTGGGSGSALLPLLMDILPRYYPNKLFIACGILPHMKESIAAQQNTIDFLKELRASNPTFMLYDNEKRGSLPRSRMMEEVNLEIVKDIAAIRGDYQVDTPFTRIDDKDLTKIIETPGRMVVVRTEGFKEKDIDDKLIEDRMIDSLRLSAHSELDYDQIVKRSGLFTNLTDKLQSGFDPHLPKFKAVFGEAIEEFEHVAVNSGDDQNSAVLIMSGMSLPDDRVQKIVQRIDEATVQLSKVKESSILDDTDTGAIKDLRRTESRPRDVNLDSLFGKYIED